MRMCIISSPMRARRYGEGYLYATHIYFISVDMIEIRSLQPLKYSLSTESLNTKDLGTGGGGGVVDPHLPPLRDRTAKNKGTQEYYSFFQRLG